MKNIFITIATGLLAAGIFTYPSANAQVPEKISYQAIIRNTNGQLVTNQVISIQISILQNSEDGIPVYTEIQDPESNENGLVSLEIGTGITTDEFSDIDWTKGPYFIKTGIDPTGGTNYNIEGASQLLSVPYAFHARTTDSIAGGIKIKEDDPVFLASAAAGITETDTASWNKKLDSYFESQNLGDVLSKGNNGQTLQIKNIADPTEDQDAATKTYVDALKKKVSAMEDMLIEAGLYKLTDIDTNQYTVAVFGDQVWMTQNLKVTRYPDGNPIPLVGEEIQGTFLEDPAWADLADNNTDDAYCVLWNGDALYTWAAAMGDNAVSSSSNPSNVQGVCPDGWHLPSALEITELMDYLETHEDEAGSFQLSGWREGELGSVITEMPHNYTGMLWSATEESETKAFGLRTYRFYQLDQVEMSLISYLKSYGLYVRCVRD